MQPRAGTEWDGRHLVTVFYEGHRILRSTIRALRDKCVVLDPGQYGLLPHMLVRIQVDTQDGFERQGKAIQLPAVVLAVGEAGIELELECSERTIREIFDFSCGDDDAKS